MELIDKKEPTSSSKYECTICLKSFVHGSSLEEHILNKHVDDKEFQCTECFETNQLVKSFATQHILNKHIKRVHVPPRFKCHVCLKTFKDTSNFAAHRRKHSQTDSKGHRCNLCSNSYRFKHRLQDHLFNVHKQRCEGVNYLTCEICSREFLRRSRLELHVVRQHVVDKAFKCPVCSKTFIDQQSLEKHMKGHDKEIRHFCDVCFKGFTRKKSLVQHLGVQHNHFFYCDKKCLRSFKNKPVFDAHIADSKQELKCYICQELINSECNLKIHTDSHVKEIKIQTNEIKTENPSNNLKTVQLPKLKSSNEIHVEKLQCDICSQTFDREAYFSAHRVLMHPNAEWKCNFENCFKKFKMYCYLRLHKMEHSKTKEFVCKICQESFYRPDSLKGHEKMHLKEKKYKCELCPKSFSGSSPLLSHIAHNHGGPKPFKCPVVNCGTFYPNNSQLNSHLVSHQTEKSFKCELCSTFIAFKTLKQLKIHQRRVHSGSHTKTTKSKTQRTKFSDAVVFICNSNSCSFETTSDTQVALHYSHQHQLPKVVLSNSFSSRATLNEPEKIETSKIIQKRYKCGICSKLFKLVSYFSRHQFAHTEELPCKCPFCCKSFKCKQYLGKHVRTMHSKKSKGY